MMISILDRFTFGQKCEFYRVQLTYGANHLYIFMVMEIKIVWDQLADRAARLKVLPFASFTPIAVVDSARRVSDMI